MEGTSGSCELPPELTAKEFAFFAKLAGGVTVVFLLAFLAYALGGTPPPGQKLCTGAGIFFGITIFFAVVFVVLALLARAARKEKSE